MPIQIIFLLSVTKSPDDFLKLGSKHLKFGREKISNTSQFGHHDLLLDKNLLGEAEVLEHSKLKLLVIISVVGLVSFAPTKHCYQDTNNNQIQLKRFHFKVLFRWFLVALRKAINQSVLMSHEISITTGRTLMQFYSPQSVSWLQCNFEARATIERCIITDGDGHLPEVNNHFRIKSCSAWQRNFKKGEQ